MKKLIPGICMALLLLVGSCTKRKYVSQREYIEYIHSDTTEHKLANKDTTNHFGIEKYIVVVSLHGDTTFVAVPYKPYPIEKILEKGMAFSIAAIIVFALAEYNKD